MSSNSKGPPNTKIKNEKERKKNDLNKCQKMSPFGMHDENRNPGALLARGDPWVLFFSSETKGHFNEKGPRGSRFVCLLMREADRLR